MGNMNFESTYLFAVPSFSRGMAHTLDLGGNLLVYNESHTPLEADTKAIRNDWKAIGKDLMSGILQYGQI